MHRLIDKRVRINLYPFKQTAHLFEAFQISAIEQGWTADEVTLIENQIKGLSLDERFDILNSYTLTYADDMETYTNEDVHYMLSFLGQDTHYLTSKDIQTWDEYDWSNFNSLKRKATQSIKRVFALFSDTVLEKDKYHIQSPPKKCYDTLEETLEAVPAGQESNTKIYPMWIKE